MRNRDAIGQAVGSAAIGSANQMLTRRERQGGEQFILENRSFNLREPIVRQRWCGREDSNFHGLSATTTSTLRVYQFRHDRTS
jgi:hypothetical protein